MTASADVEGERGRRDRDATMAAADAASDVAWLFTVTPSDRIVSAGGGLAQALRQWFQLGALTYLVTEDSHPIVPAATAEAGHYGRYSARYGEIDTSRHLLQLLRRAYGRFIPRETIWERNGRYFDAFRPAIQPNGFATVEECEADRRQHLAAVRRAVEAMDVFVFTVGRTACWAARADGAVYPMRPGVVAGHFDPERHELLALSAQDVAADLHAFATEVCAVNPAARIILTVSPADTATDVQDAAVSTVDAPARLRAVATALERVPGASYAPLFEIMTGALRREARSAEADAESVHDERTRRILRSLGGAAVPDSASLDSGGRTDRFVEQMTAVVDTICDEDRPTDVVKCVVWDLDDTIWRGVLLEDEQVRLRHGIKDLLETLDRRGIVHSIASRNDSELARQKLVELGIHDYFVYPQLTWDSKARSIQRLASLLHLSFDAIAFVDDQRFERDEVSHSMPEILCIDASEIDTIADLPRMNPRFVSEDSRLRRVMYLCDARRTEAERSFAGSSERFLATLEIALTIERVAAVDLPRAEELIARTHMLNATGYRYSADELEAFRVSPTHVFLIASLTDAYGPYGKVGMCLVECHALVWTIKLFLGSCRVASRGVAGALLHHVMTMARCAGVRLQAEFVPTDRNRLMSETYKAAGFHETHGGERPILFEHTLDRIQPLPAYLHVRVADAEAVPQS